MSLRALRRGFYHRKGLRRSVRCLATQTCDSRGDAKREFAVGRRGAFCAGQGYGGQMLRYCSPHLPRIARATAAQAMRRFVQGREGHNSDRF